MIYWTEVASPAVLRFSTRSDDHRDEPSLSAGLLSSAALRPAADGLHAVWRLGLHQLQARLDPLGDTHAAVLLPLDDALDVRALTAIRLKRLLDGRPSAPDPMPLSPVRRRRLVHVVRALDARSEGASLRDIAEGIFARRLAGRAWQDSDLQARTRRLVRSAVQLMQGGYRDLLNPLASRRSRGGDEASDP